MLSIISLALLDVKSAPGLLSEEFPRRNDSTTPAEEIPSEQTKILANLS